jgi:hypothetical protein
MGDRSPKAIHKQATQKQGKSDKLKEQKRQAVLAKQSGDKMQ